MKADFGWDFFIVPPSQNTDKGWEAGDCVFTPDGDIQVIEGPALVAQDVAEAAKASVGSLFYAPGYGVGLVDMLRGPSPLSGAQGQVVQKLREAAFGDERVDWNSVEAGQYADGKYFLQFSILGKADEQILYFDLVALLGENNG